MNPVKGNLVPYCTKVADKENFVTLRLDNSHIFALIAIKMNYAIFICARNNRVTNLPYGSLGSHF